MRSNYVVMVLLALSACGPLTPHVAVDGNVSGRVDTSGVVDVKLDISQLTEFFQTQCQQQLGPGATQNQTQVCTAQLTNNFLSFLNAIH